MTSGNGYKISLLKLGENIQFSPSLFMDTSTLSGLRRPIFLSQDTNLLMTDSVTRTPVSRYDEKHTIRSVQKYSNSI
jgi:hypothetical protein